MILTLLWIPATGQGQNPWGTYPWGDPSIAPGVSATGSAATITITSATFITGVSATGSIGGFSRASSANYFDASGVLQTASNDVLRPAYDPVNPIYNGNLIEGASTNFIRNPRGDGTIVGSPGTLPTFWNLPQTAGLTRQVVGRGTEDGIPYVDLRYSGTSNAALWQIGFEATTVAIPALSGQQWTASVFLRLVGGDFTNFSAASGCCLNLIFYSSAGGALVTGGSTSDPAPYPTNAPLRTQRYAVSGIPTNASIAYTSGCLLRLNPVTSSAIDFTLRIGAPQAEFITSSPINFSGVFSNGWTQANIVLTNFQPDPLGTSRAIFLTDNAVSNTHFITHVSGTVANNQQLCFSVYVKDGGRRYMRYQIFDTSNSGNQMNVVFDVVAGTITTAATSLGLVTGLSAGIIPVGGGWYRAWISSTLAATPETTVSCRIFTYNAGVSSGVYADGTGLGLYLFGPQLEAASSPRALVNLDATSVMLPPAGSPAVSSRAADVFAPNLQAAGLQTLTTTLSGVAALGRACLNARASTATYFDASGVLQTADYDMERFGYDPVNLNYLGPIIEAASTNYVRNPLGEGLVVGSPGTLPTNWAIPNGLGLTRTIIGTGTEDGIPYVDIRFSGTSTAAIFQLNTEPSTGAIVASSGQLWVSSAYIRLVAGTTANWVAISIVQYFNNSAGTLLLTSGNNVDAASLPTNAPLRTQRYSSSLAPVNAAIAYSSGFGLRLNVTTSTAYDFTLRIGAPQAELISNSPINFLPIVGGGWSNSQTVTTSFQPDPLGTSRAVFVTDTAVSGNHYYQGISTTIPNNQQATFSIYMKDGGRRYVRPQVLDSAATGNQLAYTIDLQTGVITQPLQLLGLVTNGSLVVTPVGNGWYRVAMSFLLSPNPDTTMTVRMFLSPAATFATYADGTGKGIYLWGAQIEPGSTASPYQNADATSVMLPPPGSPGISSRTDDFLTYAISISDRAIGVAGQGQANIIGKEDDQLPTGVTSQGQAGGVGEQVGEILASVTSQGQVGNIGEQVGKLPTSVTSQGQAGGVGEQVGKILASVTSQGQVGNIGEQVGELLASVVGQSQVGNIGEQVGKLLTGVASQGQVGNIGEQVGELLASVVGQSQVGNIGEQVGKLLTGVASQGQVGNVGEQVGELLASVVGQSQVGNIGEQVGELLIAATGATSGAGSLITRTDDTSIIVGASATGQIGTTSIRVDDTTTLLGIICIGQVGTASMRVDDTTTLFGVNCTGQVGIASIRVDDTATISGIATNAIAGLVGKQYGLIVASVSSKGWAGPFARPSSATYFDASGVLQTADVDIERFGYDPVNLNYLGPIIEAGSMNYVRNPRGEGLVSTSLSLDFMTPGTLDPQITYSRASVATYFDVAGVLQTAANNAPRWDYDPLTHVLKGLLIEDQRANVIFPSINWHANATASTSVDGVVQNAGSSPDANATAMKLIPSGTSAAHQFFAGFAGVVSTTYTFTVYVKAAGYSYVYIELANTSFGANARGAYYDLTNGTMTNQTAGGSATIQSVGNGWFRLGVTATSLGTAGNYIPNIRPYDTLAHLNANATFVGDMVSGILVWGKQVEVGGYATSYIPTTSVAVTRVIDFLTMPTGAWFNPAASSVLCSVTMRDWVGGGAGYNGGLFTFDDSGGNRATAITGLAYTNANTFVQLNLGVRASAVDLANLGYTNVNVAGTSYTNLATSWNATTASGAVNGLTAMSVASTGLPSGINRLVIGGGFAGIRPLGGWFRSLQCWNRGLSAAELQFGVLPTNWQVTDTGGVVTWAVAGTGVEDGIPYTDIRYTGTTSGNYGINTESNTGIPISNGQVWSISAYLRLVAGSIPQPATVGIGLYCYNSSGTFVVGYANQGQVIPTSAPLRTQRYIGMAPVSDATVRYAGGARIGMIVAAGPVDFTLRIGAPQAELHNEPSSIMLPPVGSPDISSRAGEVLPVLVSSSLVVTGVSGNGRAGPFARASSATYFDASGVLQTVDVDIERFGYDPVNLNYLGPIIEAGATNYVRNPRGEGLVSTSFGFLPTNWQVTNTGGVLNWIVAGTGIEDGIPYTDIRYAGTTSGNVGINTESTTGVPIAIGQVWSISAYLRVVAGTIPQPSTVGLGIYCYNSAGAFVVGYGPNQGQVIPTSAPLRTQRYYGMAPISDATVVYGGGARIGMTVGAGPVDFTLRIGAPQAELVGPNYAFPVMGSWTPSNTTYSYFQADPFGQSRAILVQDNAVSAPHHFFVVPPAPLLLNQQNTFSFYAKDAGRRYIALYFLDQVTQSNSAIVTLDLQNGTIFSGPVAGGAVTGISASITPVNDAAGWYRCAISATHSASTTPSTFILRIYLEQIAGSTASYVGNLTGVYLYGTQLQVGPLTDYISNEPSSVMLPPVGSPDISSRAGEILPALAGSSLVVTGVSGSGRAGPFARASTATYFDASGVLQTADVDMGRYGYDPVTLNYIGPIVEAASANYVRNPRGEGGTTLPTNWFITNTGTSTIQMVSSGIEDGIPYVDIRCSGTTNGILGLQTDSTTGIPASDGQQWAVSFYCRVVAGSIPSGTGFYAGFSIYNSSGTSLATVSAGSPQVYPTSAPLRTQRFTSACVINQPGTAYMGGARVGMSSMTVGPVDFTLRIGAPQAELLGSPINYAYPVNTWNTFQVDYTHYNPDPIGQSRAVLVIDGTYNGQHYFNTNAITLNTNQVVTFSIYAKDAGRRWLGIYFYDWTNSNNFVNASFDLQTGTIVAGPIYGGTASGATVAITPITSDGWYRLSITASLSSAADTLILTRLFLQTSAGSFASYIGTGTVGVYIWGAQLQVGPLTPYIWADATSVMLPPPGNPGVSSRAYDTLSNIAAIGGTATGVAATVLIAAQADLDLEFLSGALDPRITFTRASIATYYDATGTLQTAGVNVPRFDYDPVTLQVRGLLLEEARTNAIRNSTMVGAAAGTMPDNWGLFLYDSLSTSVIGTGIEKGIPYVDLRIFGTTTGARSNVALLWTDQSTITAAIQNQTWTGSGYCTLVGGSLANITLLAWTLWDYDNAFVVLGQTSQAITPTAQSLNRSRISVTRTTVAANVARINLGLLLSYSSGVAINFTIRIGLPQLELGSFPTSAIPTTNTTVARSGDVASMPVGLWYNDSTGTLFTESSWPVVPSYGPAINYLTALTVGNGFNNDVIGFWRWSGALTTVFSRIYLHDGSLPVAGAGVTPAYTDPNNILQAVTWNNGVYAEAASGVLYNWTSTSAGANAAQGINTLWISPNPPRIGQTLRRLRVWQRALSSSDLQLLTTALPLGRAAPSPSSLPIGVATTGQVGISTTRADDIATLSGVFASSNVGSPSIQVDDSAALSGVSISGNAGLASSRTDDTPTLISIFASSGVGSLSIRVDDTGTLSGIFASSNVGSLTIQVDDTGALLGVLASSNAGSLSIRVDDSAALSGVFASSSVGSLSIQVDDTGALLGVLASSSVGSLSIQVDDTGALLGVLAASNAGLASSRVDDTPALSSVLASSSVGSLSIHVDDSTILSGVLASSNIASLSTQVDDSAALSGVLASSNIGPLSVRVDKTLSGVSVSGNSGSLSIRVDDTATLSGVFGSSSVGSLSIQVAETLSGVVASSSAGSLSIRVDDTLMLSSVASSGSAGFPSIRQEGFLQLSLASVASSAIVASLAIRVDDIGSLSGVAAIASASGGVFSRTSSATYIDASGNMVLVGNDVLRPYYVGGVNQGVLLEDASNNVIPNANSGSPGGTSSTDIPRLYSAATIWKVTSPGGTFNIGAYTNVPIIPGIPYTLSAWVYLPVGYSDVSIKVDFDGPGTKTYLAQVNADVAKTGQWQRIYRTAIPLTDTTMNIVLRPNTPSTAGAIVYTTCFQVEQSPIPTSYIPTAGSAATRDADYFVGFPQVTVPGLGVAATGAIGGFHRASQATYFDSNGTLQVAGIDAKRYSYDPITLNYGLLLEGASTNYTRNPRCEGMVIGTPGTLPTNWTISATAGLSRQIIGSGIESGIPYLDLRIFGTATSGVWHLQTDTATSIAALPSQQWATSAFVRLAGGTTNSWVGFGLTQYFNNSSGTTVITTGTNGDSASFPTNAPLNAQRYTNSGIPNDATTAYTNGCGIHIIVTSGIAYDFTLRIGAPQTEMLASTPVNVLPPVGGTWATAQASQISFQPDPLGTSRAVFLTDNAVSGLHYLGVSSGTIPNNQPCTFSIFVKDGGRGFVRLHVFDNTATVNQAWASFDLTNGLVAQTSTGGIATNLSATITPMGGAWNLCTVTVTLSTTVDTTILARVYLLNSATNSAYADGTGLGVYLWGPQLQTGPYTSYISTDATSVMLPPAGNQGASSRAADILLQGTNLSLVSSGVVAIGSAGISIARTNPATLVGVQASGAANYTLPLITRSLNGIAAVGSAGISIARTDTAKLIGVEAGGATQITLPSVTRLIIGVSAPATLGAVITSTVMAVSLSTGAVGSTGLLTIRDSATLPSLTATGVAGITAFQGDKSLTIPDISATASAGIATIRVDDSAVLPNTSAAGSAGSLSSRTDDIATLSSVSATGAAGITTFKGDKSLTIPDNSATASAGIATIRVDDSATLVSTSAAGSAGSLSSRTDDIFTLSSISATGSAGLLSIQVDDSAALPNTSAIGAVGIATIRVDDSAILPNISATGAAGITSFKGDRSQPIPDVSATGSTGSLSIRVDDTATLLGISVTGTVGIAAIQVDDIATLPSVSATGAAGITLFKSDRNQTIPDIAATGSAGVIAVRVDDTVTLLGISVVGAAGITTIRVDDIVTLPNISATGSGGSASPRTDDSATLAGVSISGSAGSLSIRVDDTLTLASISVTGAAGITTFQGDRSQTIPGISVTGNAGSLSIQVDDSAALLGVSSSGFVGTAISKIDSSVIGVTATTASGVVSVAPAASNLSASAVAKAGTPIANVSRAANLVIASAGNAGTVKVRADFAGLQGAIVTGSASALGGRVSKLLVSVSATAKAGQVTFRNSSSVTLTGTTANGDAGIPEPISLPIGFMLIAGNEADGLAGDVSYLFSSIGTISSVFATGQVSRPNYIQNARADGAYIGPVISPAQDALPTNWTVWGTNTGLSVDVVAIGIEDGIPYIDLHVYGTATQNLWGVNPTALKEIPTVPGDIWTASFYFTLKSGDATGIDWRLQQQYLDANGGYVTATLSAVSPTFPTGSLGASRQSFTATVLSNANIKYNYPTFFLVCSIGAVFDLVLRFGGPQCERGSVMSALSLPQPGTTSWATAGINPTAAGRASSGSVGFVRTAPAPAVASVFAAGSANAIVARVDARPLGIATIGIAGLLASELDANVTGVSTLAQAGKERPNVAPSAAGTEAIGQIGDIGARVSVRITGTSGIGQAKVLAAQPAASLIGVGSTTTVGVISAAPAAVLTGLTGQGETGTLIFSGQTAILGITAVGDSGLAGARIDGTFLGAETTGEIGDIVASESVRIASTIGIGQAKVLAGQPAASPIGVSSTATAGVPKAAPRTVIITAAGQGTSGILATARQKAITGPSVIGRSGITRTRIDNGTLFGTETTGQTGDIGISEIVPVSGTVTLAFANYVAPQLAAISSGVESTTTAGDLNIGLATVLSALSGQGETGVVISTGQQAITGIAATGQSGLANVRIGGTFPGTETTGQAGFISRRSTVRAIATIAFAFPNEVAARISTSLIGVASTTTAGVLQTRLAHIAIGVVGQGKGGILRGAHLQEAPGSATTGQSGLASIGIDGTLLGAEITGQTGDVGIGLSEDQPIIGTSSIGEAQVLAGQVAANPSGIANPATAGVLTVTLIAAVSTGVAGQGEVGFMVVTTAKLVLALTGVSAIGQSGLTHTSIDTAILGTESTGQAGVIGETVLIPGVSSIGQAQALTDQITLTLAGNAGAAILGTVKAAPAAFISGVVAQTGTGSLTTSSGHDQQLVGISGIGQSGLAHTRLDVAIFGTQSAGQAGVIGQTVSIPGVSSIGLAKALTVQVTASFLGVASTATAGVLKAAPAAIMSGVAGQGESGIAIITTAKLVQTLTGVSAIGQGGLARARIDAAISGTASTGQAGIIGQAVLITGASSNGQTQAITDQITLTLAGKAGTATLGTIRIATAAVITGVIAQGQSGSLTTSSSHDQQLVGISAFGQSGLAHTRIDTAKLLGTMGVGQIGDLLPGLQISGASGQAGAGIPHVTIDHAINGVGATTTVGTVIGARSATVTIGSVAAVGQTASVSFDQKLVLASVAAQGIATVIHDAIAIAIDGVAAAAEIAFLSDLVATRLEGLAAFGSVTAIKGQSSDEHVAIPLQGLHATGEAGKLRIKKMRGGRAGKQNFTPRLFSPQEHPLETDVERITKWRDIVDGLLGLKPKTDDQRPDEKLEFDFISTLPEPKDEEVVKEDGLDEVYEKIILDDEEDEPEPVEPEPEAIKPDEVEVNPEPQPPEVEAVEEVPSVDPWRVLAEAEDMLLLEGDQVVGPTIEQQIKAEDDLLLNFMI